MDETKVEETASALSSASAELANLTVMVRRWVDLELQIERLLAQVKPLQESADALGSVLTETLILNGAEGMPIRIDGLVYNVALKSSEYPAKAGHVESDQQLADLCGGTIAALLQPRINGQSLAAELKRMRSEYREKLVDDLRQLAPGSAAAARVQAEIDSFKLPPEIEQHVRLVVKTSLNFTKPKIAKKRE